MKLKLWDEFETRPTRTCDACAMWNLDAPPGFRGLRSDLPLSVYFRHLPHWRQEGATYFVTFRLGDSLPQSKLRELAAWRAEWEQRHPPPRCDEQWQDLSREVMRRVEAWLDQGMGSCVLKHGAVAEEIAQSMRHFDGDRYELDCYVIMPNHVHVVVRPSAGDGDSLEQILHSWKRFTARRINERLCRRGALWQHESFDRIVRDEEHLWRCIQYIGSNAGRAGLPLEACPRWIRSQWESLGWRFEDALPGEVQQM